MTGSRVLGCALALYFLSHLGLAQKQQSAEHVRLTPSVVVAGAPELIQVRASGADAVDGEWLGHNIQFFKHGSEWLALAGVDVEAPLGPSTLKITAHVSGRTEDL